MSELSELEKSVIKRFGITLEKLNRNKYPNLSEVATFCMNNKHNEVYDKISAYSFLENIKKKLELDNR